MDGNRNYLRCDISGKGMFCDSPFSSDGKFDIVNISASGILIETGRELAANDIVEMTINFSGYLHEKDVKVKGRVVRIGQVEDVFQYGLEFVDITHKEKVEIDEIMKLSCTREHHKTLSNCDYGECTFLK